jgi:hypothetical protein
MNNDREYNHISLFYATNLMTFFSFIMKNEALCGFVGITPDGQGGGYNLIYFKTLCF